MSATKPRPAFVPAIRREGTLWSKAIETAKETERNAKSRESSTYILGPPKSGKSTILNRIMLSKDFEAGPGFAAQYGFRTGQTAANLDKQDVAHLWELSGTDEVVAQLASRVMLPAKQLATGAVIITVDLSKPREAVPSLVQRLQMVRDRLDVVYRQLEEQGHKLPQQLRQRAKNKFFDAQRKQNPDASNVNFLGVQVAVIGTKHDVLKRQIAGSPNESDMWAVLGNALRYVCHYHGATLAYLGAMGKGSDASSQLYLQQQDLVRTLCDFLAFYDPPLVGSGKLLQGLRTDPASLLFIPAGCDSFEKIRAPPGGAGGDPKDVIKAWEVHVGQTFPDPEEAVSDKKEQILAAKRVAGIEATDAYRESVLDGLMQAKREQYREQDRQLRFAEERAAKEAAMRSEPGKGRGGAGAAVTRGPSKGASMTRMAV